MVLLADDAHRSSGNIQCAGYLNASILERELTYPEGELENKREKKKLIFEVRNTLTRLSIFRTKSVIYNKV